MKKLIALSCIVIGLAACNNEGGTTGETVDSLNERKDTLLERVDSTTDAKIDSLEERREELKEKFDSSIEAKKDSLSK